MVIDTEPGRRLGDARPARVLVLLPDRPDHPKSGLELRHRALVRALGRVAVVHVHGLCHRPISDAPAWPGVIGWTSSSDQTVTPARLAATRTTWMREPDGHPSDDWYSEQANRDIRELSRSFDPDLVILGGIAMQAYLPTARASGADVIFDHSNVEADLAEAIAELPAEPRHMFVRRLVAQRTATLEARVMREVDRVWLCSSHDETRVRNRHADAAPISIVPNAIDDLPELTNPIRTEDGPLLLYPASFSFPPNADAALWLVDEIWPAVRKRIPDARLVLAGAHPDAALTREANNSVEITGVVDELDPWFRRATMMPVPLRVGSGTRLKILQAFAFGVPVVSTKKGYEGLDVVSGTHLFTAESIEEWVEMTEEVHCYSQTSADMARAARALVETRYSLEAMSDAVAQALPGQFRRTDGGLPAEHAVRGARTGHHLG